MEKMPANASDLGMPWLSETVLFNDRQYLADASYHTERFFLSARCLLHNPMSSEWPTDSMRYGRLPRNWPVSLIALNELSSEHKSCTKSHSTVASSLPPGSAISTNFGSSCWQPRTSETTDRLIAAGILKPWTKYGFSRMCRRNK